VLVLFPVGIMGVLRILLESAYFTGKGEIYWKNRKL
jgi:hypothetical protein